MYCILTTKRYIAQALYTINKTPWLLSCLSWVSTLIAFNIWIVIVNPRLTHFSYHVEINISIVSFTFVLVVVTACIKIAYPLIK